MLIYQPAGTESAASLFVGGKDQPERPSGCDAGSRPGAYDAEHHGIEVLHVNRATTPDATVSQFAGERRYGPVSSIGRYHVEMSMDQQWRQRGVDTLGFPARHDRGTPRFRLHQVAGDANLVEQLGHAFGSLPLAWTLVGAKVGRVDPNQLLAELHNLGIRLVIRAHRFILSDASDLCRRPQ